MAEVTQMLHAIDERDAHSSRALLPEVYAELRRLAAVKLSRERPGHTLQTTALVHEASLGLAASNPLRES